MDPITLLLIFFGIVAAQKTGVLQTLTNSITRVTSSTSPVTGATAKKLASATPLGTLGPLATKAQTVARVSLGGGVGLPSLAAPVSQSQPQPQAPSLPDPSPWPGPIIDFPPPPGGWVLVPGPETPPLSPMSPADPAPYYDPNPGPYIPDIPDVAGNF